ncbi:hypothetical protein GDO78_001361 [Eleutherodactylus coqui]|uniref:Uncharacterized protein n=1 Tax=Eleutherodactylus coqui TaxID=57060 RepID=A0A8J6FSQ7_ELECQ|nr:hypothetical protein GDO78_001361 [Eleutherodactylus coqui]
MGLWTLYKVKCREFMPVHNKGQDELIKNYQNPLTHGYHGDLSHWCRQYKNADSFQSFFKSVQVVVTSKMVDMGESKSMRTLPKAQ